MAKTPLQPLNVIARSPFHIYYEGVAERISAINQVGTFDILPGHADFFSVLSPGDVTIETESDMVSFKVSNGIMAVRDGSVMLFVNI